MMFALPAIAFAIIGEAREDLKPKIKATFLTAALASFLTGVTEPIEFAFLFVAPYLFVIHAILSGVAMWMAYELNIHHGFSYSAGAIDYVINLHLSHNGLLLYRSVSFMGFSIISCSAGLSRFQIPTPGREEGSSLKSGQAIFHIDLHLFCKHSVGKTILRRLKPALPDCVLHLSMIV